MRFMARLGNGDCSSRRMCRREVSQLALAAACLMPLPVAAADTTAASHAVTGPIAELNAGLLAQMKAGRAVPFATRYARLAPDRARVRSACRPEGHRRAALGGVGTSRSDPASGCLPKLHHISSYVANFDDYRGQRFVILPDKGGVGEKVVVETQIVPLSGTPVRIDYFLRPEEGESGVLWKASDIMLDGSISEVVVRRSEFYCLLGDGGVAKLIAALHRKTADLSGGALRPPAGNAAPGTPR